MVPEGVCLGPDINTIEKERGLKEILSIMKDIMQDKELYILFFCLGPANSRFTIPAVQLTDSSYVSHSEIMLYKSSAGSGIIKIFLSLCILPERLKTG